MGCLAQLLEGQRTADLSERGRMLGDLQQVGRLVQEAMHRQGLDSATAANWLRRERLHPTIPVPEARQLIVTPHDIANLDAIEKAIINSNMGLSPSNDGRIIRLSFPMLTEERRRDLAKVVGGMAEEAKQRVNGVRRAARKELEDLDGVSEDDVRGAETQLDALKDDFIGMIDAAQAQKEEELLEV